MGTLIGGAVLILLVTFAANIFTCLTFLPRSKRLLISWLQSPLVSAKWKKVALSYVDN